MGVVYRRVYRGVFTCARVLKQNSHREMPKKTGKEFIWKGDEAELLMNVTIAYKTKEAAIRPW